MVSDHEANNGPGFTASPPLDGLSARLQAECEHLRQQTRQLEEECRAERQARLAAQAERDAYHRALTAHVRERAAQTDRSTDADLDRLASEALPLTDFGDELRQLLREH